MTNRSTPIPNPFQDCKENYTKVPNVVLLDGRLSANEKVVLQILASRSEIIFPKWGFLMNATSLSRTVVYRTLKSLRKKKIIDWVSGTGKGDSNRYWINPIEQWVLN